MLVLSKISPNFIKFNFIQILIGQFKFLSIVEVYYILKQESPALTFYRLLVGKLYTKLIIYRYK